MKSNKTTANGRGNNRRATALVEHMESRRLMSGTPVPVAGAAEFQVNTQTVGQQGTNGGRSVATDANGNFVVTWSSGSLNATVFAQRYSAAGVKLGGEFQVNAQAGTARSYPAVAMNASGGFVIAWPALVTTGRTTTIEQHARRYDSAGNALGGEFSVGASNSSSPEVAIADDGSFVAAWQRTDPKSGKLAANDNVWARRFSANGTAGVEFRVNDTIADTQGVPSVAMDGAGNFLVAWQSYQNGATNDWDIYAKRYNAAGAQGPEFRVNANAGGRQVEPSAALLPGDGFAVAWEHNLLDGASGSYGDIRLRRHNGAGWSTGDVPVNTTTAQTQKSPSLDADADGNLTVIWHSNGQDGSADGVYGQQYDPTGLPAGSEFQLNAYTDNIQAYASVAAQPGGRFVGAWTSIGQDGDGQGVYARLFEPSAAVTFGEATIADTSTGEDQTATVSEQVLA